MATGLLAAALTGVSLTALAVLAGAVALDLVEGLSDAFVTGSS
ncbi:hypothetical protein [Aquabacterium sp. CECT 9606]